MASDATTSGAVAWQRLDRVTGVAGLASLGLIFVALVGTRSEPDITAATATEFLTSYQSPNTVAAPFRSFAFTLGGRLRMVRRRTDHLAAAR